MSVVADFYYALPDRQLLTLFHAGHLDAAEALVDRHDGKPPVAGVPTGVPDAVVWAELLSGHLDFDSAAAHDWTDDGRAAHLAGRVVLEVLA